MTTNALFFTYTELVRDYRKVFDQIKCEDNSEIYYPVIFRKNGNNYEILKLSLFNPEIDEENNVLKVTSRQFKDNTAFFLNFIRYNLVTLIITVNKKPKYVIEPGLDLVDFMLDRLNIESKTELKNILLNGNLPIILGGNPKKLKRKIKLLQRECEEILSKKNVMAQELGKMAQEQDKLGKRNRELEAMRKQYIDECNPQLR